MCGICGVAYADVRRPPARATVEAMARALRHRGPDDDGFHIAPGIGLGFRRLSIIDLEHGDQPIANEDGRVRVVCNGEIYNHVELRAALAAAGHTFATRSDVEVIVHLYEAHGLDFVTRLRGMFALALWDAARKRLVLARDRLGIKPLHYAIGGDALWFGSEQKAILAAGACAAVPDIRSIHQVFSYGRVIGPRTMLRGVQRLQPGELLTFEAGRLRIARYWETTFPRRDEYDTRRPAGEWAEALRAKLEESVRLHLRSDVPVGAWLSAGIDSSGVTALVSREVRAAVPTFTLRFDEPRFDEFRGRRGLDDYPEYGLAPHRIACSKKELARLPQSVWHGEDLLVGGLLLGQLAMAEATAKEVKVVVTGEGSDELLGGYSWYTTLRLLAPVLALPGGVRRAIARFPALRRRWPGAASVVGGSRDIDFERYSRSITHLHSEPTEARVFTDEFLARVRAEPGNDDPGPPPDGFDAWHPFAQLQYFDLKHRLPDWVVLALDRSSMAHSVEARVPFLDHELVEFCATIPPRVKMRGFTEKHVLRRALRGVVPPDIRARKKYPLRVPLDEWLRGDLPELVGTLLEPRALHATGVFCPDKIATLRARHRMGKENLGQVLSSVIGVQLWHELFCRRDAVPT